MVSNAGAATSQPSRRTDTPQSTPLSRSCNGGFCLASRQMPSTPASALLPCSVVAASPTLARACPALRSAIHPRPQSIGRAPLTILLRSMSSQGAGRRGLSNARLLPSALKNGLSSCSASVPACPATACASSRHVSCAGRRRTRRAPISAPFAAPPHAPSDELLLESESTSSALCAPSRSPDAAAAAAAPSSVLPGSGPLYMGSPGPGTRGVECSSSARQVTLRPVGMGRFHAGSRSPAAAAEEEAATERRRRCAAAADVIASLEGSTRGSGRWLRAPCPAVEGLT